MNVMGCLKRHVNMVHKRLKYVWSEIYSPWWCCLVTKKKVHLKATALNETDYYQSDKYQSFIFPASLHITNISRGKRDPGHHLYDSWSLLLDTSLDLFKQQDWKYTNTYIYHLIVEHSVRVQRHIPTEWKVWVTCLQTHQGRCNAIVAHCCTIFLGHLGIKI